MNDRDEWTVGGCLALILLLAMVALVFLDLGIRCYEESIIKPRCHALGYDVVYTSQSYPFAPRLHYCVTYGLEPRIEYVGTLRELAGQ